LGNVTVDEPASGPQSLTLFERELLRLQHQILEDLCDVRGSEREYHHQAIEILANGFTGEYGRLFMGLDPELAFRDCRLLWRILDMFRLVEPSFNRLSEVAKADIGEHANHLLSFRGFDHNDSLEGRFAAYAKFLVGSGRWREQADAVELDGGNSHIPNLATYQRMLAVFEAIQDSRGDDSSLSFEDRSYLNVEELTAIYAASSHRRQ
jgi:hypothetical protein